MTYGVPVNWRRTGCVHPRARNVRRDPNDMVAVRIAYSDADVRQRIKTAGGIWRARQRLWEVDWKTVRELGLQSRVVAQDRRMRIPTDKKLYMRIYRFSICKKLLITRPLGRTFAGVDV